MRESAYVRQKFINDQATIEDGSFGWQAVTVRQYPQDCCKRVCEV